MTKLIIFDFNRTIYDPERKRLIGGSVFVLKKLKKHGLELYLMTRQEKNRKQLIKNLGIQKYFSKIIFTQEKTYLNFKKLLGKKNHIETYVIGDRVMEEIKIGNCLKLKTIWLKQGKFSNEKPSESIEIPDFTIKKIQDALKIVL